MSEAELRGTNFDYAFQTLAVGFRTETERGYKKWPEKTFPPGTTITLGGQEVELLCAGNRQLAYNAQAESDNGRVLKKEIWLDFRLGATTKRLRLQKVGKDAYDSLPAHRLVLETQEPSPPGEAATFKREWSFIVDRGSTFGKPAPEEIDPKVANYRKKLAVEMVKAITGGPIDASEGLSRTLTEKRQQREVLTTITKPWEARGISIAMTERQLTVNQEEIPPANRALIEEALRIKQRRNRLSFVPAAKIQTVIASLEPFQSQPSYDNVIGTKGQTQEANRRLANLKEVAVSAQQAGEDEDFARLKYSVESWLTDLGLKTTLNALRALQTLAGK